MPSRCWVSRTWYLVPELMARVILKVAASEYSEGYFSNILGWDQLAF